MNIQPLDEVIGMADEFVTYEVGVHTLPLDGPSYETITLVLQRGKDTNYLYASREVWQQVDFQDIGTIRARPLYAMPATAFVVMRTMEVIRGLLETEEKVISGPVGMVMNTAQEAEGGSTFSLLLAIASMSLFIGFLNLLPFPALDGGQIFLIMIRAITRRHFERRHFERFAAATTIVGAVVLLGLVLYLTIFEILDLFK